MSEPFLGQIKMFAGNFAPRGYAFCDGQLLAISQNDALFSLLGTIYGGDGRTTFGLPDLRGRLPISRGQGPGLSSRTMGSRGGQEKVTLSPSQIPSHSHPANGTAAGNTTTPVGSYWSSDPAGVSAGYNTAHDNSLMAAAAVQANASSNAAHENRQPFLAVHFIIALSGIFPSRN